MQVFASLAPNLKGRLAPSTKRWALAVLALTAFAGCDLNPNVEACSVAIAPASLTVTVNGRATITGTAFDCKGTSIPRKTISYQSSNTSVATVTTGGEVIGVSVGQAVVSAVANSKSAEIPVTVIPEAAANVTVSPGTITLRETNTKQFIAVARNSQGNIISGRSFRWAVSNSSVASIDQNGMVTAVRSGNVIVSADADGVIGQASVTITPIPLGNCSIAPTSQKLTVTEQSLPVLTLRDTANNVVSNVGRTVTWNSENDLVASVVTNTGLVTAKKAGTALIRATPESFALTFGCFTTVEVVDPRIATVQIQPRSGSLRIGIPRQLTVTLFDSLGTTIPPGRPVTWSSVFPAIANVSATGLVTGTALGTARIAINAEGARDTVTFAVTQIPVGTVRVSPLSAILIQGQTTQLNVTIEDSTGAVVTDRPVEWISGDPTKATVTQTGFVRALAPGSVNIAATAENRFGTSTVNVLPVPVDTIVPGVTEYVVALDPPMGPVTNKSFAIALKDAAGNQIFSRTVAITSSSPSVAQGAVNSTATLVQIGAFQVGTTNLTLRALDANGQPEGKTTVVKVTILPAPTTP